MDISNMGYSFTAVVRIGDVSFLPQKRYTN